MRTRTGIATLLLVIASGLFGCKKDSDAEPSDLGISYFPVAVGSWVEYQVDSIWRDDEFNIHDSVSYRMLERISEEYLDPEGRPSQRIKRFVKDENDEWVVRDVWTATRSNTAAERTEENKRRLKLSFPTRNARKWDINVYNTDDELEVAFREVDRAYALNGMAFDSTLLVRNTLPPNQVVKRNFEERYARHVGMIEKYWEETNTQTVYNPGQPPQVTVRGFRLDMAAVAYGN